MNCEFCDKQAILKVRQYANKIGNKLGQTNTEIVVAKDQRKLNPMLKCLIEPAKLDGTQAELKPSEGFTALCFIHYKEKIK